MGRRALPEAERRRAETARMAVTGYVRRRALSDRLRVVPPRRLGAEEFREVARLAANVNQVARALNTGRGWVRPETALELARLRELLAGLMPEKRD